MSDTAQDVTSQRPRREPTINDDGTISLWGIGPTCPGCGGPTHAVTGDPDAERPWWCQDCNVRLDGHGDYGAAAQFPSGSEPGNKRERDTGSDPRLKTDGGEEFQPKCYDCDRRVPRRHLQTREVPVEHEDGPGYDMVPVPICTECEGRRFGFDCPNCGITHDSKGDARYCCRRRPGEAPDCPTCGRRMTIGASGWSILTGRTVDWAECESCEVGWGPWTGFVGLGEDGSREVVTDGGRDLRVLEAVADLPPSATLVYKVLEYVGECTQREIVLETGLSPRTVRYGIERLDEVDAIEKRPNLDDARQQIYSLPERAEVATDGGATTEQMLVAGDRAMVSYGPCRDQDPGAWMLSFTNRGGRLEVFLDEDAMYEIWTEVQYVPWPRDGTAAGDRRRALVRVANDASADQIQDAIEVMRAGNQTATDGGSSRWKRVGLAFDRLLQRLRLLGRWGR